ncbi:hypothetical protein [Prauserella sp. PE36]|uniref:hypothetical protein n=1 Tax=Prauserella sp. PE36 TaxID=1504709 RepID=UPI001313F463|nr:hypothetical protein [Prauserella sp. PE36]
MFTLLWHRLPWGRAAKLAFLVLLAAALGAAVWWWVLPWLDEFLYGGATTVLP